MSHTQKLVEKGWRGSLKVVTHTLDKLFFIKEKRALKIWHQCLRLYAGILLAWGFYRVLIQFPIWFEETVIKGVIFGFPVLYLTLKKNKQTLLDLGITTKHLVKAVNLGIIFGITLGLAGQIGTFIKYGSFGIKLTGYDLLGIGNFIVMALFTAFWEQLVFAGFLLGRLSKVISNEWKLVSLIASMFALIHVPALVLIHQFSSAQIIASVLLLWSLSVGSNILMLRTKNLMSPIIAHTLWGITIFVFS